MTPSDEPPSGERPVGPVDGTQVPRFAGASTFARMPAIDQVSDYEIAVVGAPFDGGTSYRPGARFGPLAIRTASRHLRPAFNPGLDVAPFERVQVVDAGDVPCNPFSIDEAVAQIHRTGRELIDARRRLITIGGDHTVALPMLRAAYEVHGPLALVHFDAHLDTWDTYFGAPVTHGTIFRRAFEEGLLLRDRSTHVGIRGPLYSRRDLDDDATFGFQIFRASDLDTLGADEIVQRVHTRTAGCPVYLSIDVDVLDPAFAPGTGTPEMGGLTSRELLGLLRRLRDLSIVAGDVVEVSPGYDQAEITALAGATLVYDIIGIMALSRR